MPDKFYDTLMRVPIIAYTIFFVVRELNGLRQIIGQHPTFDHDLGFIFNLAARISVLQFMLLLVLFHVVRYQPLKKFDALAPKVTALLGLTLSLTVLLLPRAGADPRFDGASLLFTLSGNILSIVALMTLGRSLSIMPEARKLVVDGLYRWIRHPLYFAEEIALIGVFLQFRTWTAAALLSAHLIFQLLRMHWEEKILNESFPEYGEYCRRTHRLIPGVY